jgi:hypothetical protein
MEPTSGWARKETVFPSLTDAKYVPGPATDLPIAGISLSPMLIGQVLVPMEVDGDDAQRTRNQERNAPAPRLHLILAHRELKDGNHRRPQRKAEVPARVQEADKEPRRLSGECSQTNVVAPTYSPPVEKPCTSLVTTSSTVAQIPSTAYPGKQADDERRRGHQHQRHG